MSLDIKALIDGQVIPLARNPDTNDFREMIVAPDDIHSAQYPVVLTAIDEAGNKATKTVTLNVVPHWIQPKKDWKPSDYINIEDWRRIMGNLCYLKELADKMYPIVPWVDMGGIKVYSDWPQASEWDAVEANLESLKKYTYPLGPGRAMSFYPGGNMIDFIELNRIETSIEKFYIGLTSQYENIKVLPFILGGDEFGN